MEKINLPQVTLVAMTGKDYEAHQRALDLSSEGVEFGDVKLIRRPDLKTIDDWNRAIVFELGDYVDTEFALLVHADGYVINPEAWRDEFLDYDYTGAPWPLPSDNFSYRDINGQIQRVGNSVSLRSKKLMSLPSDLNIPWKSYYGNTNEDGFICVHNRHIFEANGCKFAPLEIAKYFSKEHEIPENVGISAFAFHSL